MSACQPVSTHIIRQEGVDFEQLACRPLQPLRETHSSKLYIVIYVSLPLLHLYDTAIPLRINDGAEQIVEHTLHIVT